MDIINTTLQCQGQFSNTLKNELPVKTIDMSRYASDVAEIKDILEGRELAARLHTVTC